MRDNLEENLSMPVLLWQIRRANRRKPSGISIDKERLAEDQSLPFTLLAYPSDPVARRDTLLVFLHGGGWHTGSPWSFRFIAYDLAWRGYPVASLGYRLAPQFQFPSQMEDICQAYQQAQQALARNEIFPKQVVLIGQSAGAQLAGLLAFDPEWQARCQLNPQEIAGLVSVSGPLDLQRACQIPYTGFQVQRFLGDLSACPQADPMKKLGEKVCLPVLCLHGDRDRIVPLEAASRFVQAVQARGGPAELAVFNGWHHSDMVKTFMEDNPPARKLWGFIDAILYRSEVKRSEECEAEQRPDEVAHPHQTAL